MSKSSEFRCLCNGENIDCIHCNGAGYTKHQIGFRSTRGLAVDKPSSESFKSKKDLIFRNQIANSIGQLRIDLRKSKNPNPAIVVSYVRKLMLALEMHGYFDIFYSILFQNSLNKLVKEINALPQENEDFRILTQATNSAAREYANLLSERESKIVQNAPMSGDSAKSPTPGLVRCPHCGARVFNQDHHDYLQHPKLRQPQVAASAARKKPSGKKSKKTIASRPATLQKPYSGTATPKTTQEVYADSSAIERALDARRKWGGRFRDNNGTFGSYPVHDSMDDESDAG